MKIDDNILTKFPRPRDGLILVYLMTKAINGIVEITYQQISDDTDYTKMQVRSSIQNLVSKHALNTQITRRGLIITIKETNTCGNKKTSNNTQITRNQHSKSSIEERKQAFNDSIRPFVGKYPNKMLREFFDYWSEPNPSKTKMRFELEKTWEINRRLSTWANREKPKGGMSTGVKLDTKEMNYDKSNDWG